MLTIPSSVLVCRTVTLPNGSSLLVPHYVLIFLETSDLSHMTPAMLTKCGVVAVEEGQVSWRQVVARWLERMGRRVPSELVEFLWTCLGAWIPPLVTFMRVHVR